MPQDSVERFLGRLITDDDFRERAKKDFTRICFENDFDLTQTEQEIIQKLDLELFIPLAGHLDKGVKRCGNLKRVLV